MWLLVGRHPKPDAAYWPGRRWVAALDAVVWPALWVLAVFRAPVPTGIFGHVVVALAIVLGARRIHCALLRNERYRFTTLRWGAVVATLLLIGAGLKFSISV